MKQFFSGLYHFIISVIMWTPFQSLRRLTCKLLMKKYNLSSSISRNVCLKSPYRISIGSNCNINKGVLLDGRGGLVIGNNVDIAQEVNIWTEQHDYNDPSYKAISRSVTIDDYAWVASRATILPGVHIGRGAVIACGAVVTKDVLPFTVVAGIPARVINRRNENALHYKLGEWTWFK